VFFFINYFIVRNTPEAAGLPGLEYRYNPVDAEYNGLDDKTMMHWTQIFRIHRAWWLVLCMICFGLVREGFLAWSIAYVEDELNSSPGDRTHTIMSMAITGGSVAGTILVGYMADFAFARNRFGIPLTFNVILFLLFVLLYWVKTLWTSVSVVFGCSTCLFALQGYRRILSMDMGARHTVAIFTGVLAAAQFGGGGLAGITFGYLIDKDGYQVWLISLMVLSAVYAIVSGLYWRLKALRLTGRVGNPLGL
jgi:sugar phosphate permease